MRASAPRARLAARCHRLAACERAHASLQPFFGGSNFQSSRKSIQIFYIWPLPRQGQIPPGEAERRARMIIDIYGPLRFGGGRGRVGVRANLAFRSLSYKPRRYFSACSRASAVVASCIRTVISHRPPFDPRRFGVALCAWLSLERLEEPEEASGLANVRELDAEGLHLD
jgi:hypothetical protein